MAATVPMPRNGASLGADDGDGAAGAVSVPAATIVLAVATEDGVSGRMAPFVVVLLLGWLDDLDHLPVVFGVVIIRMQFDDAVRELR